jgi:hypothetical protein
MKTLVHISAHISLYLIALLSSFSAYSQAINTPSQQISGLVTERLSGEAVIGVNVLLVKDTANITSTTILRGARTNKFGFYSLANIPEGAWFLVVRGLGYRTFFKAVEVRSGSDADAVRINVLLDNQRVQSQAVTIEAQRDVREAAKSVSKVDVSPIFLQQLPSIGGEKDVFRLLQLLPGVKTSSELSSGLNVRGGSSDQNLVLLDGAIVYNPSHLGGFLSTFNADALQDIKLMKGAFPAEYGGRLSSVIDLTMREGTKEKFSGAGSIGTLTSRLLLEGPIGENATFMLSARRFYLDLVLKAVAGTDLAGSLPNYYFYDLNGKINYKLSDNDRLYLSGYYGQDVMDYSLDFVKLGLDWGNATGNLRWAHIISPSLFTNFSLIYTKYNYSTSIGTKLFGDKFTYFTTVSQIQDWTARAEAQYTYSPEHSIKAGTEVTHHTFRNYTANNLDSISQNFSPNNDVRGIEAAVYVQDEWEVTPKLALNLGLRAVYFGTNNRFALEPRISASYNLVENVMVKGAFGMTNQFLHLLTRNDIALPSDTWFPSTESIVPSSSTQFVLGAETPLLDDELFVSVEGYYKTMSNIYEYRDDATFSANVPIANELTSGSGVGYGVEVFLQKRAGAFTGWIGYTLSLVQRTFPELNNGKPYFPRYDRRHDISVVLAYKLDEKWEFGATWIYGTGQAMTMPAGRFDFPDVNNNAPAQGALRAQYFSTERNGFRLPATHRLDLNVTYSFPIATLPCYVIVSTYNTYNRANPLSWYVDSSNIDKATGLTQPVIKQVGAFPLLPSISFGFKF